MPPSEEFIVMHTGTLINDLDSLVTGVMEKNGVQLEAKFDRHIQDCVSHTGKCQILYTSGMERDGGVNNPVCGKRSITWCADCGIEMCSVCAVVFMVEVYCPSCSEDAKRMAVKP